MKILCNFASFTDPSETPNYIGLLAVGFVGLFVAIFGLLRAFGMILAHLRVRRLIHWTASSQWELIVHNTSLRYFNKDYIGRQYILPTAFVARSHLGLEEAKDWKNFMVESSFTSEQAESFRLKSSQELLEYLITQYSHDIRTLSFSGAILVFLGSTAILVGGAGVTFSALHGLRWM